MLNLLVLKQLLDTEKIRFLIVGAFNTAFGFGTFVLVQIWIGQRVTYIGSLYISHLIGSIVAFNLYRRFVFPVSGNTFRDFLKFQTVYIFPLLVNTFLLPFFVALLHWNVFVSQAITTVLLTISSYLGHKYFSFRRKKENFLTHLEISE